MNAQAPTEARTLEEFLNVFDRRRNETVDDHVERLFQDPWFEDATASELAEFCGCSREDVAKARRRFFMRQRAKLVFEHAELIAELVEWPFDGAALISLALERYGERFTSLGQPAGPALRAEARAERAHLC